MLRRVGNLGVQGRLGVPFRGLLRRSKSSAEVGAQNGRGWDASQAPAATARMEARMEKFEDRFLDLYKMYARQTQWMAAGLTTVRPSLLPLPCHVQVCGKHISWWADLLDRTS